MNLLDRAKALAPWLEELYCQFHRISGLDWDLPRTLETLTMKIWLERRG